MPTKIQNVLNGIETRLGEVNNDSYLSDKAKDIYSHMSEVLLKFPKHHFSASRIGRELGYHRNTVQHHLQRLLNRGYISREKLQSGRMTYGLCDAHIGVEAAKESLYDAFGDVAFRCDQATMGDVIKNVSVRYPNLNNNDVAELVEMFANDCREAEMSTSMTALTRWLNVALPIYAIKLTQETRGIR